MKLKNNMKEIIKTLQVYCDKLNQYLPCKSQEDVDNITNILNEFFQNVKDSHLYWSREIYIDSGFNSDNCAYILTHRNCLFVPTDDIEEHLGLTVIYEYEKE